jgi:hypothetical protein
MAAEIPRMGVIKGEMSMAPITTAVEGKIKPAVAITADSADSE